MGKLSADLIQTKHLIKALQPLWPRHEEAIVYFLLVIFCSAERSMRRLTLALAFLVSTATPTFATEAPPAWAYPMNPGDFKSRPEDGIPRHVPESNATYSVTQLRDRFMGPVWHP